MQLKYSNTLFFTLAFVALAGSFFGCDDPKPTFDTPIPVLDLSVMAPVAATVPASAEAHDAGATAATPTEAAPADARPDLFVRSHRCGECHEKMRLEWSDSAHARASHGAAYRKALESVKDPMRALCQSCHLPSYSYGQNDEQPGRPSEGVSCDGCHTLSKVVVDKTQAVMTFDPTSGSKYGPILGASGHYFHDMAYSVLHTKSEICAGCHHLMAVKSGAQLLNIPVVSDYSDWQKYGKGKPCQDCHMPSRGLEAVAKGAKPRPNVPAHLFPGAATLGKLVRFEMAKQQKPGEVTVEVQHSAGHALPSGYVDRRLIVRAEFFTQTGAKVAAEDHAYGIKLVDAANQPAPFFRAVRVLEDKRMIPGRPYLESFPIPTAPVGAAPVAFSPPTRVTLSLLAAPTAPELSAVYGEPELTVLKSTSLTLPVRPGGR